MPDAASEPTPSFVSVVICTRNRADKIGSAVRSVLANNHPSFEVTVIDQSSDASTAEALAPLRATDDRLRYWHSDQAGLSRAYNEGIRRSSGDVLAFTDDDCIVPRDWLTSVSRAFAVDADVDLLYGQVVPLEQGDEAVLTPTVNYTKAERLSRRDGFRVSGMGANFAARRRLFDTIGGFDEILGGGGPLRSSQDFDLAYRAYRAGSVILLTPDVTLRHDGRREEDDWPTLLHNYGVGDGAFYTKHVRCGDLYALTLLLKQVSGRATRVVAKSVTRRQPLEQHYLRGVMTGIRESRKFAVDRGARTYKAAS